MEQHLRAHFDRSVDDDPGVEPGEMAHAAIVEGVRLRRRRSRLAAAGVAAGVVVAIGTATGLHLAVGPASPADPPMTVAAAMAPVTAPSCQLQPVERDVTDAVVFLTAEVTDGQRAALESALREDPRVDTLIFESREQAFLKFRARWARNPDLLAAVTSEQLYESFRVRLSAASQYAALRSQYASMPGVDKIVGRSCAKDAPVGGAL